MANITEKLAELEHKQWVMWSKSIAKAESISPERLARWKKLWIPYSKLPEEEKIKDRVWAEMIFPIFTKAIQEHFDNEVIYNNKIHKGKRPLDLWKNNKK